MGYIHTNGTLNRKKLLHAIANYKKNLFIKVAIVRKCVFEIPKKYGWTGQCLVTKLRYCSQIQTLQVRKLLYYLNTVRDSYGTH